MSTTALIPQAFWFRMEFICPHAVGGMLGAESTRGKLLDLPSSCALPAITRLEGQDPWAELRIAWSERGLGLSAEIRGKTGPIRSPDPQEPDYGDGVQVWIDTRDSREIHRATRYCHRFAALLLPAARGKGVDVQVAQKPIHRALADAPSDKVDRILHRAERLKGGWTLELFFPAETLNGFDPETNRRLGLMIQVTDPDRGDQYLGVGREFPVGEDPSLWSTLILSNEPVVRGPTT